VDLVVLPAHVEHAPRMALRALAARVPVVASEACGLGQHSDLFEVPAGDVAALVTACRHAAARAGSAVSDPAADRRNRQAIS
jgi:hypothetical protein